MRTIHLRHQADAKGPLVLDHHWSTRPEHVAITDVPRDVPTPEVIKKLSGLQIKPWPSRPVPWPRVKDLQKGTAVSDLP